MGPLLRSSAEVRTAIKLAFGVVSGVGPGIDVLDGSPRASRATNVFKVDNISTWTVYSWNLGFTGFLAI